MFRAKPNTARHDIPYIDVHHAHEGEKGFGPEALNREPFPFMPSSFKELRGAFEYKELYCPLQEVVSTDPETGKKVVTALVEDTSTPPAIVKNGLKYWARVRSARKIVEMAADRYPNGCWLRSRGPEGNMPEYLQYVDFSALLKLGAFLNGGSATGISLLIVEIMIAVSKKAVKRENGWDSDIRGRIQGLGGAIRKWIAKSSLKKLGQGPKVHISGKVSTSHSLRVAPVEILVQEDGKPDRVIEMPVVCMNPADDMVKLLRVKEGDIVTFGRTPMVYRGYALVRFSKEVAISGVEVSAEMWALFNRGDGDGDPEDTRNEMTLMGIDKDVYELIQG
jgi:hypothetical protein